LSIWLDGALYRAWLRLKKKSFDDPKEKVRLGDGFFGYLKELAV
jgi:hypothetical protein